MVSRKAHDLARQGEALILPQPRLSSAPVVAQLSPDMLPRMTTPDAVASKPALNQYVIEFVDTSDNE